MGIIARAVKRLAPGAIRLVKRLVRLDRESIANLYLRGEGIEIGALHNPLPVPGSARVRYVDRMPVPELRRQYPELSALKLVAVDIVDEGETLSSLADASQDFVIANHFLEHCQNPIAALGNMLRVLRGGGILYLTVPDKRYTFDVNRPVTPLAHLLRDYREGPEWSRRGHFEEYIRVVHNVEDVAELARQIRRFIDEDYSIHFHVWTQTGLLELLLALPREIGLEFDLELFFQNRDENIAILRKRSAFRGAGAAL